MPTQQTGDLDGLKARAKATWMAGNYTLIAETTAPAANKFIARQHLRPGVRLLDVACGSGNLCVPAAKAGAAVTGVDIAPNLLDAARSRAARESVDITFDEGDAERLPYQNGLSTSSSACSARCSRPAPRLLRGSLPGFAVLAGGS
jgi:2-polyprenyl-3-methyl-5-hydroxy-6-metoxy-1,4-benzoquinol methylase